MNIAEMNDREITEHVERLARTVEEKNVLVGAILRAELDDFLRDLREGAKEAQSSPSLPSQWEELRPGDEIPIADKAEYLFKIFRDARGYTSVCIYKPGIGWTSSGVELPTDVKLMRVKQSPKAAVTSNAVQGISVSVNADMVLKVQEMIRDKIWQQQEELIGQPPPIAYNWDYFTGVQTNGRSNGRVAWTASIPDSNDKLLDNQAGKKDYRHTRRIIDDLDEIQKRAKRREND